MPVTRAIERNTLPFSNGSQKSYPIATKCNETNLNLKPIDRRLSDLPKKSNGSTKTSSSNSFTTQSQSLGSRRSMPNDGNKQNSTINRSGNQQEQRQSTPPEKPKSILPKTTSQSGYVTPSKLFNMMGYGLEHQYLFMHAHYLYIIDCRTREKFNESHIITAIHWEDALNGSVYISIVERFSEIVLYDDNGELHNTSTEMHRISNRFTSSTGSRSLATLDGGFQAFRTLFPFICTQSDIRSAVDREKFLTIYPSVVLDNQLYLGAGHQATNWKVVRDLKITHILNISIEHQCVFSDKIKYLHLQMEDKEDVLLKDQFIEAINFIDLALKNPSNRVLVHCNLGISRSTTLILAYLMKTYSATLSEAFKFLRHRRPIVCPNIGFLHQLIEFEYELYSYSHSDVNDPIFH